MVSGEIIKEMIKPSSPTPPHLKNLQLSFLDQLSPPIYIHIILYFHSAATSPELKRSLSDALALYYPLAGRLRHNSWVDCNDSGAEYAEARFNDVRISDVVENPKTEELIQYVPLAPSGRGGDVPLAVSAFIWKHMIDSAASKNPNHGASVVSAATHAVDIRRRASPPLPHRFFGNACARAMAVAADSSSVQDYYNLALKLREVIKKADADYVRRLEDGGAFLKYYAANEENDPALKEGGKTIDVCGFTSWCRLPAYEADFGWGKPVWVSIISVPVKNLVFFLGTKSGDGIEAWVSMVEEEVELIETNYHLLDKVGNTTS